MTPCWSFTSKLLSWTFLWHIKKSEKIINILVSLKSKSFKKFHATKPMIIIYENLEHWIMLILFFYLVLILSVLFKGTWCWSFTGHFLYLWKLMLPHLKSVWQIILKISQKSSFCDNWSYHHINRPYCAIPI